MKAWLDRLRQRKESRSLARRAIPEALWTLTLGRLPFIQRLPTVDLTDLRRLASLFLDSKEFTGAGGLVVTDEMAVCIAVQACLPVLRFGLKPYEGFVGIVVHPDEVVARRSQIDEDGVVHEYDEVLSGEAMDGGPIMLSWHDVSEAGASAEWGYNVVVHEFAHVLDMADGAADGVPALTSFEERQDWLSVLLPAYESHCRAVDAGIDTLLDPYGATAISEFFAVAVESFFVTPHEMRSEHPDLYWMLARYFRQDPSGA